MGFVIKLMKISLIYRGVGKTVSALNLLYLPSCRDLKAEIPSSLPKVGLDQIILGLGDIFMLDKVTFLALGLFGLGLSIVLGEVGDLLLLGRGQTEGHVGHRICEHTVYIPYVYVYR